MRKGDIIYKYPIKVLEETLLIQRLSKEKTYLETFKRYKYINEEWGKENIDNCNLRIKDLEEAIVELRKIIYD